MPHLSDQNHYGDTALIVAVLCNNLGGARSLMDVGADPGLKGEHGITATQYAPRFSKAVLEMLALLQESGADVCEWVGNYGCQVSISQRPGVGESSTYSRIYQFPPLWWPVVHWRGIDEDHRHGGNTIYPHLPSKIAGKVWIWHAQVLGTVEPATT